MDEDQKRREDRAREFYEGDFPIHLGMASVPIDAREANALEFIAYQARAMRKELSAIREALEKIAAK